MNAGTPGAGPGRAAPSRLRRTVAPEDRWARKQGIAAGLKTSALFDTEAEEDQDEDIEDIDIEVNLAADAQPLFLRRLGTCVDRAAWLQSEAEESLKVRANPDSSMARAASLRSALAKERQDLRTMQRNDLLEVPRDINRAWIDPMPSAGERMLAAELRGMLSSTKEPVPAWKERKAEFLLNCGSRATSTTKSAVPQSLRQQRESLPIFKVRKQFLEAVETHQFLVVVGETGSGKSTQIPQYLFEEGYANSGSQARRGLIGCTQPRRIAAISVAQRVAEERGCRVGEEVGYSIRFEDCTSPQTRIKYMTDGMLLRECLAHGDTSCRIQRQPLEDYSVIIIDEAHERSVSTDVLFGLIKEAARRRPDLRVIIASATLEAASFASFFADCPMFYIRGREYPVEILYTKEPETDYLDAAMITVMQIHLSEPEGDILLFLTGQEEIDCACEVLHERMRSLGSLVPELIVLPVYAALPVEQQQRIFAPTPAGKRKVVVATNIAETSLTVEGVRYVVDPGFSKKKWWDPRTRRESLLVVPISRAAAKQRAGRAGRTGPGKTYRLYTQKAFEQEMAPSDVPEIARSDLAFTVLTLKALGIEDVTAFDFMPDARPSVPSLVAALDKLYCMGALDDEGLLTSEGRKMAAFPLEPGMSRMLLASVELGCVEEILTVAAMLSVPNIFHRPKEKQEEADRKKRAFFRPEGDHVTLLAVYEAWKAASRSAAWCRERYIDSRAMRQADNVRKQLRAIMDGLGILSCASCGRDYTLICKAVCCGFFRNVARRQRASCASSGGGGASSSSESEYRDLVDGQPCFIHPSSCLFHIKPEWLVYHEVTYTTKEYMRYVCLVDPMWLVEGEKCRGFFRLVDPREKGKGKRKRERLEPLYNPYLKDQQAWRLTKRKY